MDNAENNNVALKHLQGLLQDRGIEFDHKDQHIPCYPHIINICVSHIVASLTNPTFEVEDVNSDFDDEESDDGGYVGGDGGESDGGEYNQQWIAHLKCNPVKRARTVVRAIRSSGQRKEALSEAISTGNIMRIFKDGEGNQHEIKDLQLIKDVKHRWDSLYYMIDRLFYLKEVGPFKSLPF
jgi:hypothetical protein